MFITRQKDRRRDVKYSADATPIRNISLNGTPALWNFFHGGVESKSHLHALRDRLTVYIFLPNNSLDSIVSLSTLASKSLSYLSLKDPSSAFPTNPDMLNDKSTTNGHGQSSDSNAGSTNFTVKTGLAQMLKGGVIMDVVNAEQVNQIQTPTAHWPLVTHTYSGPDSRRGRCLRRYGPRACSRRHSSPGWRCPYV